MWYFAYGHNTNDTEMRKRIPNAKKIGKGLLQGYHLVLYKYANIEPSNSHMTGVVWDLTPSELKILDMHEEVPHVYRRKKVNIEVDGIMKTGVVYIMTEPIPGVPSKQYLQWMRTGYKENKLIGKKQ
jgi:gamma-glutamylcyclotransferase (GGCT)/AIG2-like uncharacterized protein YtfP